MKKRTAILAAMMAATALIAAPGAKAQSYPNRPINFIVPHAAGSTADVGARIIAEQLQQRLGQPVVVANRAGAGGTIGTQAALNNPADGYTIILIAISNSINHVLRSNLPFDITRDVRPVSLGWVAPNVAVVHPSLGVNNLQELIEAARRRPGTFNYASSGIGTSQHFAGEYLQALTGITIEHIPYSVGAQSVSDALAGRPLLVFNSAPMLKEHIESGALRALGVTGTTRSPVLPNVPTFQEAGLRDFDVTAWWGLAVKTGTPDAIVARLAAETRAVLAIPQVEQRFIGLGATASPSTPEELAALIRSDIERYGNLARSAGIAMQ